MNWIFFCCCWLSCRSSFKFWLSKPYQIYNLKIFSRSVFHSLVSVLWCTKVIILMKYLFCLCCLWFRAHIWGRTSSTVLKRSEESGHCCLIPNLRRLGFNVSPLKWFWLWIFHKYSLPCWENFLVLVFWHFYYERMWNIVSAFSVSVEMIMSFFPFC